MANGKLRSFYRPHPRVLEDGAIVNHVTGEVTYPPSMTKQEFRDECDINNIVKQFSQSGMLTHVSARAQMGAYLDLPDSMDFQQSLQLVRDAEKTFMDLPSKLRERFNNEPAEFLAFCADPKNMDEMRTLGLAKPLPPQPPGSPAEPSGAEGTPSEAPPPKA